MSAVNSSASDVDLGRLFAGLARDWKRILSVAIVLSAVAFVLASLATPYYRAETRLLIDTRESVFTRPRGDTSENTALLDEEGVVSQVEIITSTDILKRVAKDFDLASLPEFERAIRPSLIERFLIMVGLKSNPADVPAEERVLEAFRDKLTVFRVERSRVIAISFSSRSPKLAADIPNAIADTYLAFSRDANREATSRRDGNYLPVDARVFSRAVVPLEPYFPKIVPIVGSTFAASLLVMALATLLGELFSGRAMRAAGGAVARPTGRTRVPIAAAAGEPSFRADHPVDAGRALIDSQVSVHDAAEMLIAGGASRALFVSPEGDEAAASAVMVARNVADAGLRVVLVDLTASGAASRPMLDSNELPGITDLLSGTCQIAEVIHADHYSESHLIPVGTADQRTAMRAVERLPSIMHLLGKSYDLVIVECGPAGPGSIRRLVSEGTGDPAERA